MDLLSPPGPLSHRPPPAPHPGEGRDKDKDCSIKNGEARVASPLSRGRGGRWERGLALGSRLLEQWGHEVIIANPRKVFHLIGHSRRKNDRIDALSLADLASVRPRLLYPIEHISAQAQADRAVLLARDSLVRARSGLINQARGAVKTQGGRLPQGSAETFARKVKAAIPETLVPALGAPARADRADGHHNPCLRPPDQDFAAHLSAGPETVPADSRRRSHHRLGLRALPRRPSPVPQKSPGRRLLRACTSPARLEASPLPNCTSAMRAILSSVGFWCSAPNTSSAPLGRTRTCGALACTSSPAGEKLPRRGPSSPSLESSVF